MWRASWNLLYGHPVKTNHFPWSTDRALWMTLSTLTHGIIAPAVYITVWIEYYWYRYNFLHMVFWMNFQIYMLCVQTFVILSTDIT